MCEENSSQSFCWEEEKEVLCYKSGPNRIIKCLNNALYWYGVFRIICSWAVLQCPKRSQVCVADDRSIIFAV